MKKTLLLLRLLAVLVSMPTTAQSHSDMLERALSSVVTVAVYKTTPLKRTLGTRGDSENAGNTAYEQNLDLTGAVSSGSGFVVERNGKHYVVTNAHVVDAVADAPGSLYVFSISRKKYEVSVVGGDTFYDFALLEFTTKPGREITSIKFRTTEPRIGETVFAIGNPLGEYPYTVSDGIISAKNRVRGGITGKYGFIQSTATTIWGNSGGPLVDTRGEVVGINSQIAFAEMEQAMIWQPQINFALESAISRRLLNDMLTNNGRVRRAYLGLELVQEYNITAYRDDAPEYHLKDALPVVSGIIAGAPAAALSARTGHQVTAVNGVTVRNLEEALGEFEKLAPNSTVRLALQKGATKEEVAFTTGTLDPSRLSALARYVMEEKQSIRLQEDAGGVYGTMTNGMARRSRGGSAAGSIPAGRLQIIAAGVYAESDPTLWHVGTLGDLGAVLRCASWG